MSVFFSGIEIDSPIVVLSIIEGAFGVVGATAELWDGKGSFFTDSILRANSTWIPSSESEIGSSVINISVRESFS